MQVIVDGTPVTLDKKNVLGSGGEGTVYKAKVKGVQVALKVYEKPSRERAEKLIALDKLPPILSDRIVAPQDLARNTSGLVVGFTMPLIAGNFTEISSLSNKKYRRSFGITTKDIAQIFLDGIPTLGKIHSGGRVVGDLNDLNALTQNRRMLFWDVDSWQFGRYPCPVATETFLDPSLYGINLSMRPVFSAQNDWYSYAVMLFKSLLLVHPYGGTHKAYNDVPARAVKKVTVFDKDVIYPVIAISPDILTDDLHDLFEKYFKKGQRNPFPEKVLHEYLDNLRECTACGTFFPGSRGSCPVCSAKMIVVVQKPITSTKDIEVVELIRVNGQVLYTRAIGDEVRVLAEEKGRVILYIKRAGLPQSRKDLFANVHGAKFAMTDTHLFVNHSGSGDVLAIDLKNAKLLGKLSCEVFTQNRKASFRASDNYLFRVDGSELKYGTFNGGGFEETVLRRVMENQTWFWVDDDSDVPSVFGFFQVVRQQMFWMARDGKFFDVDIPQLATGENILDISAKVSSGGVTLLRKTQVAGKNYLRQELIDDGGKVIHSNKVGEVKHPNPSVHGQAFATGLLLHPTDRGFVQESVASGATKVFPATKGFVDSGDGLIRIGNSILVTKEDRVIQITMK
jgi:serine/threonine protein kinase